LDYQNRSVEEIFAWCEAMAFGLPAAMTGTFDTVASFTIRETEAWLRLIYDSGGQLIRGSWPQFVMAGDIETLAAEIEQIRVQLRSEASEHKASFSAAAARFDHLRDEIAAERDRTDTEFQTMRDEVTRAAAVGTDANERVGMEVERLRGEMRSLREEIYRVLKERDAATAAAATALKELRSELRALRDRIDTPPADSGGGKVNPSRKTRR
jgi:hypothetical protein